MEKHYCERCGTELSLLIKTKNDGYDSKTGKKLTHTEYQWVCPRADEWGPFTFLVSFWNGGHRRLMDCLSPDYETAKRESHEKRMREEGSMFD